MIKSALLLFILLIMIPFDGKALPENKKELKLLPQQKVSLVSVQLTEDEKHWLRNQKSLHIGVYPQVLSSMVQTIFFDQYSGINADYLSIIQNSLDTDIKVINYENREKAIQALDDGELNAVLTGLEYQPKLNESLISSIPVTHSWPSLMASISNTMSPLASRERVRIATIGNYPDDNFIYASFPNAEIVRYDNYESILNALATEKDNYFIGDSLTTSLWLSQEFNHTIVTLKYWAAPQKNSLFLFSKNQPLLQQIIDSVLSNINNGIHSQLSYSAIDKSDLSFLIAPVILTTREQEWLKQHKKIRVLVNPWTIPFTMLDSEKDIRGIIGDILNLISVQTGLSFEIVVVNSLKEAEEKLNQNDWSIMVPAAYNTNVDGSLLYTKPFVTTQFVSVVKKERFASAELEPGMRVSLADDHPIMPELIEKYPKVIWVPVNSVSIALNLLADNKVDAAIANRLAVRYFSEHYYPDLFNWQDIPDVIPAFFSLAVSPQSPELQTILDKARDKISQREMFQIVSKWLQLPEARIETWELYNRQFYLVVMLAAALVLSTTVWAIYLTKEVRKRKRSQRLLIKEKIKAQQASKQNREFLSRMSHELRTPVSAIIGYLELLQNSAVHFKSEDKVSVDQATQASHSLLKLIGEILDLEKVESGIIEVIPKWGKIDNLIRAKVILFHAVTSKKGILIDYTTTIAGNKIVLLDFQLLGQVLNNIIGNAVKFTQQGSIRISVSLQNNETLIIQVTDTGPGIPKNIQSYLFKPFIQAGHQTTQQGSGLGLTISRVLMKKMNGSISLESEVNEGTTITIALPVETAANDIVESLPTAKTSIRVDHNLHVLIADDQPASRLLLQRQLATLGIKPDEAADGEAALTLLQQTHYDVLITDVNMPVMDGVTLTKLIRENNTSITICGLTATAQIHERERCLAAGMNFCLFKPINISQLTQLLSEIKPEVNLFFDMKRLTVLTQGNRILMLSALKDAQHENYRDLSTAHTALTQSDYQTMKYHIHRIRGTALLLGSRALAEQTQLLEEQLLQPNSDDELFAILESIRKLLAALDTAVQDFTP